MAVLETTREIRGILAVLLHNTLPIDEGAYPTSRRHFSKLGLLRLVCDVTLFVQNLGGSLFFFFPQHWISEDGFVMHLLRMCHIE